MQELQRHTFHYKLVKQNNKISIYQLSRDVNGVYYFISKEPLKLDFENLEELQLKFNIFNKLITEVPLEFDKIILI